MFDDSPCILLAESQVSCMDKDDLDAGKDCASHRIGDSSEVIPRSKLERLPSLCKGQLDENYSLEDCFFKK